MNVVTKQNEQMWMKINVDEMNEIKQAGAYTWRSDQKELKFVNPELDFVFYFTKWF